MPWVNALMANFWVNALMANLLIIYNFEKKIYLCEVLIFLLIIYRLAHIHKTRLFLLCLQFFFGFSGFFLHSRLAETVPKAKRKLFSGPAVSAFVLKLVPYPTNVARKCLLFAPCLPWSGISAQDLEILKSCAASAFSGKSCRVRLDLENCTASALSEK